MTPVLLLDAEPATAEKVRRGLAIDDLAVDVCSRAGDALTQLAAREYACVVTELALPDLRDGLVARVVARVVAEWPGLPVIILTGRDQVAAATAAHRAAVYDVCAKPVDVSALALAIRRAIERRTLQAEVTRLRRLVEQIGTPASEGGRGETLEAVERRHILEVMATHRGNKAAAAAVLGVDRKTLYRKLLRYSTET